MHALEREALLHRRKGHLYEKLRYLNKMGPGPGQNLPNSLLVFIPPFKKVCAYLEGRRNVT